MTEMLPPDNLDLPALLTPAREDVLDLPMPLPERGPRRLHASPVDYPEWLTIANQRHIRGLARDRLTNDLWLATSGGVLHWTPDMKTFTRYGSEHGLIGNNVSTIAVDEHHRCWVAYEQGGIGYFDGLTWRTYDLIPGIKATCFSIDSMGHLWIASTQGIFSLGDAEPLSLFKIHYAGDAPRALAVSQTNTQDKHVWLCNARGVFCTKIQNQRNVVAEKWIHYLAQPGILKIVSSGELLWLGTTGGLMLFNPATGAITQNELWPCNEITALAPSLRGVWVAYAGKVGQATSTTWIAYGKAETERRPDIYITGIVPLDEETAWIGTHDGLFCVTPTDTQQYSTDEPPDVIGLASRAHLSNMIQALATQQQKQETVVWIGTATSLFRFDTDTDSWRRYEQHGVRDIRAIVTLPDQSTAAMLSWLGGVYALEGQKAVRVLPTERIGFPLALTLHTDGTWWVAGLYGLYYRQRDAADWKEIPIGEQLPEGAWIRSLLQVSSTHLWLGTSHGLYIYDIDSATVQPFLNIAGDTDIFAMCMFALGQEDYCCIGTRRELYIGNVHESRSIQPIPSLSSHTITALLYDKKQEIMWVGTAKGLFKLNHQQSAWTIVQAWHCHNSGLAANRVTALALSTTEQEEQRLWIGTPCGLSCFTY